MVNECGINGSKRAGILLLLLLLIGVSLPGFAQDANYWSSSYGPGAYFTPGSVIARNRDSGVLFYNPALLALQPKNAASITGTIYQLEKIKLSTGAGNQYPLQSTATDIVPLIASNSVTIKTKNPVSVVYAIVSSTILDYKVNQRRDAIVNVLNDSYSPGNETFVGQYSNANRSSQTGAIAGLGWKISSRTSFGLSAEGWLRKQDYLLDTKTRAVFNSSNPGFPPVASVQQYYQVASQHIGWRVKLGLAHDLNERNHIGWMITTPLLRVAGKSTLLADLEINNIKLAGSDVYLLANTRQEDLKTVWKMPLSIAAGYSHDTRNGQLYFALEYFLKEKEYNVITPRAENFIRPDTTTQQSTIDLLKMKDARKAVLNASIGARYQLSPTLTLYGSLRTDFTYAKDSLYRDDDGFRVYTSSWNNYHLQFGANMTKRKFSIRSGCMITYGGRSHYRQEINFDQPNEANLLQGTLGTTRARHWLVGVLISYIHNL